MSSEDLYLRMKKMLRLKDVQIQEIQKIGIAGTPTPSEMGDMNNPDKVKDLKLIKNLTKLNKQYVKQIADLEEERLKIVDIIEKSEKEKLIKKLNIVVKEKAEKLKAEQEKIDKKEKEKEKEKKEKF